LDSESSVRDLTRVYGSVSDRGVVCPPHGAEMSTRVWSRAASAAVPSRAVAGCLVCAPARTGQRPPVFDGTPLLMPSSNDRCLWVEPVASRPHLVRTGFRDV